MSIESFRVQQPYHQWATLKLKYEASKRFEGVSVSGNGIRVYIWTGREWLRFYKVESMKRAEMLNETYKKHFRDIATADEYFEGCRPNIPKK